MPSGTFTASLTFCTSSAFVTFESFTGVSLSFAVSTVGVVVAAVFPSTGTSTVFDTPLRVTVTGTTFLPSFSVIVPYVTVSVSLSASPFAITFSFTFAWSSTVKLSPTTGTFEILAGFVSSFTANVNSSAFLVTSTLIVFDTPSRVTITGTTFLPSLSAIAPYSTA